MKINEIFKSINGEVSGGTQGRICTFIRLQGCNFYPEECSYCDTKYAQDLKSGYELTIPQIIEEVEKNKCNYITITGGEPLFQEETISLINQLADYYFHISIETNGSIKIPDTVHRNIAFVIDWKLGSSGMSKYMNISNLKNLVEEDIIKFVIADKDDFEEAICVKRKIERELLSIPLFAFSPILRNIDPRELICWMINSGLNDCILSVQLHKLIGVK